MTLITKNLYHMYNRGNNREKIFYKQDNYLLFLKKINNYVSNKCNILCYCLMPNHFHFLIQIPDNFIEQKFSNSLKTCLSSYTRAINNAEERTGSLFQQHTKFKSLTGSINEADNYALICFNYIHQNPLRSSLVSKMEDWEYSSFRDYAGLRKVTLCNKDLAHELLGIPRDCKEFYDFSYDLVDESKLANIF